LRPAFQIIKSSADGPDLSKTKVLDTLHEQLKAVNQDAWVKHIWVKSLDVKEVGKKLTFSRPYLRDTTTGSIITCHPNAWMDRVGFIMWGELILGFQPDKKRLLICDNCKTHIGKVIDDGKLINYFNFDLF
jgi:hypothetical protein